MPRLRVSAPLWLAHPTRRREPRYPEVANDLRADVAVVGGGVTGAAVAWLFSRRGVRVAVLEATRVGRSSTAASTALMMQEPDTDFAELARRYGQVNARRVWRLSRAATRDFIDTLEALGIHCHLQHRHWVYYALGRLAGRRLHDELRHRRRAGIPGRWLDAAALRRVTGIEGAGAIRTSGNAQADPYFACTRDGRSTAVCSSGAAIGRASPRVSA